MRISDWSSDVCSSDLIGANSTSVLILHDGHTVYTRDQGFGGRRFARVTQDNVGKPFAIKIGRASRREGVCQYVSISVVAFSLKQIIQVETQRTTNADYDTRNNDSGGRWI